MHGPTPKPPTRNQRLVAIVKQCRRDIIYALGGKRPAGLWFPHHSSLAGAIFGDVVQVNKCQQWYDRIQRVICDVLRKDHARREAAWAALSLLRSESYEHCIARAERQQRARAKAKQRRH